MASLYVLADKSKIASGLGPLSVGLKLHAHHFPELTLFFALGPFVGEFLSLLSPYQPTVLSLESAFPFVLLAIWNLSEFPTRKRKERMTLKGETISFHLSILLLLDLTFALGYFLG